MYFVGLSQSNLAALKAFSPESIQGSTLDFFEFLKNDTDSVRDENVVSKDYLVELYLKAAKAKKTRKPPTKNQAQKDFEEFAKKLDSILFVKNSDDSISEIKWDRIDEFCNILRLIERSDERKVRWALYKQFKSGKTEIPIKEISSLLSTFKIKNMERILQKILKIESVSGLDGSIDEKNFVINHDIADKMVDHYLSDSIEEPSRRSPGKLDEEILSLLDEGSYSNQEISKILSVDEAMVSRSIGKLRNKNKIILSSFGDRGARFFTTNCDNCPFGTTKASCRKEALSYIISSLKEDYDIDLTTNDFDDIESNQAILAMKRVFMMARKNKATKLESNLNENLSRILTSIVDHSLEVKTPQNPDLAQIQMKIKPLLSNLPTLYQLGLLKGAQSGVKFMDELLRLATKSIKKEDRLKVRKHANDEINQFLKNIGVT